MKNTVRKVVFALLLVLLVASAGAIVYCGVSIYTMQARVNHLLNETGHSAMAGPFLERDQAILQNAILGEIIACGLLAVSVTSLIITRTAFKLQTAMLALLLFSTTALSIPIAAIPQRFYARVEMTVPADSHLQRLDATIVPIPATQTTMDFVAYHFGIAFDTEEWLAGGYITTGEAGIYYIEEQVNGQYRDIYSTQPISYSPFYISIIIQQGLSGEDARDSWKLTIYDSTHLILNETQSYPSQATADILCAAGGESVSPQNQMKAHFSNLRWKTVNFFPATGYWTGDPFSCITRVDYPYCLKMFQQYYDFIADTPPATTYFQAPWARGKGSPQMM